MRQISLRKEQVAHVKQCLENYYALKAALQDGRLAEGDADEVVAFVVIQKRRLLRGIRLLWTRQFWRCRLYKTRLFIA
jgi:hypothetical protein